MSCQKLHLETLIVMLKIQNTNTNFMAFVEFTSKLGFWRYRRGDFFSTPCFCVKRVSSGSLMTGIREEREISQSDGDNVVLIISEWNCVKLSFVLDLCLSNCVDNTRRGGHRPTKRRWPERWRRHKAQRHWQTARAKQTGESQISQTETAGERSSKETVTIRTGETRGLR